MKKIFVLNLIAIVAAVGLFSSADSRAEGNWRIGAVGGIDVSSAFIDAINTNESTLTGINAGILAEGHIKDWFYFQPQVLYIQKGVNINDSTGGVGTYNYTVNLNYIDINLLAKGKWMTDNFVAPFIMAGPYVAFKTNAKGYNPAPAATVPPVQLASAMPTVNAVDLGLTLIGGGEFKLTDTVNLDLQAGYEFGITNVNKVAASRYKNTAWLFQAAATIPLN